LPELPLPPHETAASEAMSIQIKIFDFIPMFLYL
jgi:hypothetical protein